MTRSSCPRHRLLRTPQFSLPRSFHLLTPVVLVGLMLGCQPSSTAPDVPSRRAEAEPGSGASGIAADPRTVAGEPGSVKAIMQGMIDAYRSADHYSDEAVIRLAYMEDGRLRQDEAPISVRMQRPNRLRLQVYQVKAASDGRYFRAWIDDEASGDLDRQFSQRAAPAEIDLGTLQEDPILHTFLSSGLAGYPIQLQLLLHENHLEQMLGPDLQHQRLEDQDIDDHACWRIQLQVDDQTHRLWIDQRNHLLRRLEFPAQGLFPPGGNTATRLVADFENATFAKMDDDFQLDAPPESKQVRYFIRPPEELPSPLFGKRPGVFELQGLADGQPLSSASLRGKVAVLVWFRDHAACRYTLMNVQRVQEKFAGDKRVEFLAVCGDPRQVTSDETLRRIAQGWKLQVPVYRDTGAFGQRLFQIDELPTLIVMDQAGALQIFEERLNAELADQLPVVVQRLLEGDNLAGEILAQVEAERRQYEQDLKEGAPAMTARPEAARPAQPQRLKLAEVWRNDQLESPGNILVVPSPNGSPRILVFDGLYSVAELDPSGSIVQRHTLSVDRNQPFTYLRTAVDGEGRRFFAAGAVYGPQAVVLDENFQVVLTYPPEGKASAGVNDIALDDLDGNGELELLVAFSGARGVHSVSLQGKLNWSHTVGPGEAIGLLVAGGPDKRRLLITQGANQVTELNSAGLPAGNVSVARETFRLFPLKTNEGVIACCAVSPGPQGNLALSGLDAQLGEIWMRELPRGAYGSQIQFVTSGGAFQTEQPDWIIASPDGSILLVKQDGTLGDSFALGGYPTGLAFATWNERRLLFIAQPDAVLALEINPSDTPRTARGP